MALPNVNVNVTEESYIPINSQVAFVPAVILKTKSGPIGTVETIKSESQFIKKFGNSDTTVPAAYGIQTYLRTYSYVYVTRVAGTDAAIANLTIQGEETDSETPVDLITAQTVYKTDMFNGIPVELVYDDTGKKIYIQFVSNNVTTTSIKENIDLSTATADLLSQALDKIVDSFNSANVGITLKNAYADKTSGDTMVKSFTTLSANFESGNSGNTTIDNDAVIDAIDLYVKPELGVDVIIHPEFTDFEVVEHSTKIAESTNSMVLVSSNAENVENVITAVENYPMSNSLAIYYPDVYYSGFSAPIPASVAVLSAYAKNDSVNKWGAPAGVNRGNLTLVQKLAVILSKSDMAELYDNEIPVNCINDISGVGFIVWGQKTTGTNTLYQDRINIARLVKYVTKQAYLISYDYLFEPIEQKLFSRWSLTMNGFLDTLITNSAISEYKTVMDSSNNTEETIAKNELHALIRIKPLEVAEFIDIDLVITDQV